MIVKKSKFSGDIYKDKMTTKKMLKRGDAFVHFCNGFGGLWLWGINLGRGQYLCLLEDTVLPMSEDTPVYKLHFSYDYGKFVIPTTLGALKPGSVFRIRDGKKYNHGLVAARSQLDAPNWVYWIYDTSLFSIVNPNVQVEFLPDASLVVAARNGIVRYGMDKLFNRV